MKEGLDGSIFEYANGADRYLRGLKKPFEPNFDIHESDPEGRKLILENEGLFIERFLEEHFLMGLPHMATTQEGKRLLDGLATWKKATEENVYLFNDYQETLDAANIVQGISIEKVHQYAKAKCEALHKKGKDASPRNPDFGYMRSRVQNWSLIEKITEEAEFLDIRPDVTAYYRKWRRQG